jgi:hypothetical protein
VKLKKGSNEQTQEQTEGKNGDTLRLSVDASKIVFSAIMLCLREI